MNAYEVKLAHHGFFEVPATCPEGLSFRVGFNPSVKTNHWSVLTQDEEGIKWRCVKAFHDLDRALSFAVSQALDEIKGFEFKIKLPCGRSFKRPGKIPAENVMASMGWLYIHELIGYAGITDPNITTVEMATQAFKDKLEGTTVIVDSVDFVGDDDGYWCARYLMPYDGFLEQDRIESQTLISFASENIEIFPDIYDFQCRKLASPSSSVINLQDYRAAKAKAA